MLPRHERRTSDDAQEDANRWMVEGVRKGLRVVRLKGGNGFVFGRGGEEVLYLRREGIRDVEIVPGLTSCVAAGEAAMIPVTHRGVADQFCVITGRGEGGRMPSIPLYDARRTIVIMMGIGRIGMLVNQCIEEAAFPSNTPVAVVEKGTWEAQKIVRGRLDSIEKLVMDRGIRNHSIIYIGGVVAVLAEGDEEIMAMSEEMKMANIADEGIDVGRYELIHT
ncbi:uroporphyrin-III C-methyltransferase [Rhizophlyctis rosea]|uniref:Uroporphyrin-III C-methyltransferase n=1 Tax=Rhizophlyctis rosea TaxID=64517 RepID=A0AAD5S920_9FUNG|nr:uroporphyrin-III C-methyltransferase [Rhizophlyctis rosea]